MTILILGKSRSPLRPIIEASGCTAVETEQKIDPGYLNSKAVDYIVSYGYRHILGSELIDHMGGKIINLHISLLPWNRGAAPNFWSFLEDTPKGVTIHYIDAGIDTGDIIAQKEVAFDEQTETLASSYEKLSREIVTLFAETWPQIVAGTAARRRQPPGGTYHAARELTQYEHLLAEKGWQTPVADIRKAGAAQ
jgi:methionyl-tRNA formyltransferase